MQKTSSLYKIILTALFIAICLVLRNFSYMVYFGGGAGMRVGIAMFFSKLPALLFGPLYGGMAEGITDVLAYFIKPDGAYLPLLTLTAVLGGVMAGFMWKKIKHINIRAFSLAFILFFSAMGIFGVVNAIFVSAAPNSAYGAWLIGFGKKTAFFTVAPLVCGILAGLVFILDTVLRKKTGSGDGFIKLFTVLIAANLTVTTLNTFVLMLFIPSLGKMGFIAFYIPRFVEECIMTTVQSYVVLYILKAYARYKAA